MANRSEIVQEYIYSLRDLRYSNNPLITVLTQSAQESIEYADDIFEAIKNRLLEVSPNVKLPILYLMDSIIRNVGGNYKTLFQKSIISLLRHVLLQVDEHSRHKIIKLRQSWNDVINPNQLEVPDINIGQLGAARSVVTSLPEIPGNSNYVNLQNISTASGDDAKLPETSSMHRNVLSLQHKIIDIQRQLLEVEQRKLELDCFEASLKLQQEAANQKPSTFDKRLVPNINQPQAIYLKYEKSTSPPVPTQKILPNPPEMRDPRSVHSLPSAMPKKRSASENLECSINKKSRTKIYDGSSVSETTPSRSIDILPNLWTPVISSRSAAKPKYDIGDRKQKQPKILHSLCLQPVSDNKIETNFNNIKAENFGFECMKENCVTATNKISTVLSQKRKCDRTHLEFSNAWTYRSNTQHRCGGEHEMSSPKDTRNSVRPVAPLKEAFVNGNYCGTQNGIQTINSIKTSTSNANTPPAMDVNELIQKLIAKGLINPSPQPEKHAPSLTHGDTKPNFSDLHSLKLRQTPATQALYEGQQCSHCGLRFSSTQSIEYEEHLDYHSRQYCKSQKNEACSRSWY